MTKQEIFPLYVGQCRIFITEEKNKVFFAGYNCTEEYQVIVKGQNCDDEYSINDCQLELKKVSNMSEEDLSEFLYTTTKYQGRCEITRVSFVTPVKCQYVIRFADLSLTTLEYSFNQFNVKEFLFLINNGYALDDEWFNNGIAVEEVK